MEKIDKERILQIESPAPLLRSAADKISKNGLEQVVDAAVSPLDFEGRNILSDRSLVQMAVWNMDVQEVKLGHRRFGLITVNSVQDRINKLVKQLETNAVYLSVDTDRYWPLVYDGKKFPIEQAVAKAKRYPDRGGHAIVLVGYEISDDTFFLKDSNFDRVIAVNAKEFVQTLGYAFILKQKK